MALKTFPSCLYVNSTGWCFDCSIPCDRSSLVKVWFHLQGACFRPYNEAFTCQTQSGWSRSIKPLGCLRYISLLSILFRKWSWNPSHSFPWLLVPCAREANVQFLVVLREHRFHGSQCLVAEGILWRPGRLSSFLVGYFPPVWFWMPTCSQWHICIWEEGQDQRHPFQQETKFPLSWIPSRSLCPCLK